MTRSTFTILIYGVSLAMLHGDFATVVDSKALLGYATADYGIIDNDSPEKE